MSEPPATTRSSSPLRIRSAPMPTAELELAQAEEMVITRPRAPLMRLMIEVQWETRVAATIRGRIRSHCLRRTCCASSSVRTRPLWELPRHTPTRSGSRSRTSTPAWRIASRYASTVRRVARSIHDRACASISTGTSSPKLLASSPMKRQASKWVTFAMESRLSSRACLNLDAVAPQWREGSHSDDHGLVALARGEAHGLRSVAGHTFTRARRHGQVSFVWSPSGSPFLPAPSPAPGAGTRRRTAGAYRSKRSFNAGILRRHAGPCRCSRRRRRRRGTRPPRRPRRGLPSGRRAPHRARARTWPDRELRPSRCG